MKRRPESAFELTPRQAEVLACLADGLRDKAIAARLGVSLGAAENYVSAVLDKLGVTSRAEAAEVYRQQQRERVA